MKPKAIDWDEDLPPAEPEEEYQALVRSLKRTDGFRLLFVECSPAEGERLISRVKTDIPQPRIEVLPLDKAVYNFYDLIEELPNRDRINILFVKGLEYSLYEYEQEKKALGWESKDIYSYSWRGVPPVLINLNQQRERFRDNFKICFVFVVPKFVVNYFIQRAPDFFDWRSSLFKFSMDGDSLQAESIKACSERWKKEDYVSLTPEERKRELVRIQTLIDEDRQTPEQKAELFYEQALLYDFAEQSAKAIASYDKALEFKPDYHEAWYGRGIALGNLGRLEEEIASFDKALEFKPDLHDAWNNRGYALYNLGRLEEAIASFDKALEFKPDLHEAWNNRGGALVNLGRLEEAIASYDKALEFKPNLHEVWLNRGNALGNLGRLEEAIASYDKALEFKTDDHEAWINRGNALGKLGRWEEAIASYDKVLEFKPDDPDAFYNKACCYALSGQVDSSIQNLQRAIALNPHKYREVAKTDSDFDKVRSHPEFQALIQG
ncbi:tetratricopeptide repeat protein [Microcoleus sp. bin38.metabat.b11b12b14.051]|uniref:tetratricopeptide repeat protein n=1 Tax=Microcoleus sp. bin38.metabat.b11b12b14.051 TaxID=2742709 RepID=UPI0025F3E2B7|nr:tetratricopeptide repeat protein [Microcoleus sp. bin38.metabat.b11b12b14.051]